MLAQTDLLTGFCGVISGALVALTCALPIFFRNEFNTPSGKKKLARLYSFAVGSVLGDIFLHHLPEIWRSAAVSKTYYETCGLILIGYLIFAFIEPIIDCLKTSEEQNGAEEATGGQKGSVSAYVNLFANVFDNFSHGVSIGGAYLLGIRAGVLTTFSVLLHEVPHEISDFAILLRAGLTRTRAAQLQIMTGCVSLIGVVFAFLSTGEYAQSEVLLGVGDCVPWIVPFAIGPFLHISLTCIAPQISRINKEVREESAQSYCRHCALQLLILGLGILLVHMTKKII